MPAELDSAALPDLERRLRALSPDTPARWGRMDASALLRHLRAALEMSLGEIEVPRLVPAWIGAPLGWLFTRVLPRWPRHLGGRNPPVRALHPPASGASFDEERQRVLAALRRFVERRGAAPCVRALHPVFGELALQRWARVHALHLAHHLRQFGV